MPLLPSKSDLFISIALLLPLSLVFLYHFLNTQILPCRLLDAASSNNVKIYAIKEYRYWALENSKWFGKSLRLSESESESVSDRKALA